MKVTLYQNKASLETHLEAQQRSKVPSHFLPKLATKTPAFTGVRLQGHIIQEVAMVALWLSMMPLIGWLLA